MASPIVFIGWTNDDKVPGFYGETKFGQGRVSVGEFPVRVLITGTKGANGTMTPDQDIEQIISLDDAIVKLDYHSTATQQSRAALSIDGVNLWAAPPAEGSGAVSASVTISIGGTWTTGGQIKFYVDGRLVPVPVASTENAAAAETNAAAAFSAWLDGPFTAAATTDCVVTCVSKGTQGNSHIICWELDEAPAGLTVTVTGGTAIRTRMVPFSGGTGTESVANIIALMKADTWDYIAAAQTDATNLGLFKAHMASDAMPTIGHLEHMVAASNGTLVSTQSISQTTLNDPRSALVWLLNCETHPAEIAAGVAALRSVIEPQNPNYNYDDVVLPFVAPQRYKADVPVHATLKTALNTGVTPLKTENGVVKIVRGIVTRCLEGTSPNYNTLDWGDAIVPDRIRKEIGAAWGAFKLVNPYVGRDPVGSEKAPGEGVGTPLRWEAEIFRILYEAEAANWVQDVDKNKPQAVLDSTRRSLVAVAPVVVRWQQHAAGVSVRQQAAA